MIVVLALCSSAVFSAGEGNGLKVAGPFERGARWCAVGDSITHGGDWTKFVYLYYLTRYPGSGVEPINCGSGGDTAPNCLKRFDADIAPHRPTIATIMFGVNDVWWEHSKLIGPDDYIKSVGILADRLRAIGSRVVLVAPPPYDATAANDTPLDPMRSGLDRYVGQLTAFATEHKLPLVDFYHPMLDLAAKRQAQEPRFSLFEADRVHPNVSGHFVMAYLFLKAQGCAAEVSSLALDAAAKKVVRHGHCSVKDLRFDGTVRFSLMEDALPFPVEGLPAECLTLVPFMDDLNREVLCVAGLAGQTYELLIDDTSVGVYSSAELAGGVDLAGIANTPQNRQAQRVAELNTRRHEVVAQKLRYIRMLEHGQLGRLYPDNDVESARPAIQALLAGIADPVQAENLKATYEPYFQYKPRQAEFAKEAAELLAQANAANKPEWHRYELRPVGAG